MAMDHFSRMQRRAFLKLTGAMAAFRLTPHALALPSRRISVVADGNDPIASSDPVKLAAGRLRNSLVNKGFLCDIVTSPEQAKGATFLIAVASAGSSLARNFPQAGAAPSNPESVRLTPGHLAETPATLVSASGPRGFVYGLLELAERVQFQADPAAALHLTQSIEEEPANEIRSIARAFCSEVEDKAWYYDKNFWRAYLDLLVPSCVNRFNF